MGLVEDLTTLLTNLNGGRHTEPTEELVKFIEKREIDARIEQSWRCRELIEANANSPEDAERYGDVVLLDVDDLNDEKEAVNG